MTTSEFNWSLVEFDDVLDYVSEMVGKDFIRSVHIANNIIEDPTMFTGPKAAITAIQLAAHRTKIGSVAQFYKMKSAETKKPGDRLTKDALMVMYDALGEMINTLKLQARFEKDVIN